MKFSEFAEYLERLEKVSSRIEITKILAELFERADKNEIEQVVNLSLGQLAPSFESEVFNVAEKLVIQAVAKAYGEQPLEVVKLYKQKGDLGDVVFGLGRESSGGMSVSEVFDDLLKIAKDEGEGSVERKVEALANLLSSVDRLSAKFIARIPIGKLRLGFSDKTILDALSWMEAGDKSKKSQLNGFYQVVPDVAKLAGRVKNLGVDKATAKILPVVGIPVLPMLAQRLTSATQMIEKMGKVGVEPKFDGLRIQIHLGKSVIRAFTRNLNEVSWMFPELKKLFEFTDSKELILDSEAVGVNVEMKTMANFQTTMTRRRKHDIENLSAKVPIKFYIFDILFADGTNIMDLTYEKRREILGKLFKKNDLFIVDDYIVTTDPGEIEKYVNLKIKQGLEGIMVKKYDSAYVPGRLGWRWVKMKQESGANSKLADTVDCIVMGYSGGRGKRAGFGVGQFLVGVVDFASGGHDFVVKTVTKVGTGLTDEQFKELKKRLTALETLQKPKEYEVHKNLTPDYWVIPKLVVEVSADEITKSPTHTAGLALRFPRLVNFRDDKSPSQATTISEVKKLFNLQKS